MKLKGFTTTLIAMAALGTMTQVQAQTNDVTPPPNHHHRWGMSHEERLDRLSEELNLTEDQKAKVQAVFDEMRQKMQTAFQDARTNANTQLQGILTPEQYQRLQEMWQERKHHWRHHGGTNDVENNNNNDNNR